MMDGLRGYLTSSPALHHDKNGRAYLRLEWGRKQWAKQADGTFTETGTDYGTALYRGTDADELFRRLRKGDTIIALGSFETFEYAGKDGQAKSKTMFHARHLGHDASRTLYAVARIPRALAAEWGHTQALVAADFDQRAAKLTHAHQAEATDLTMDPLDPAQAAASPQVHGRAGL